MIFKDNTVRRIEPSATPFPALFKGTYIVVLHMKKGAVITVGRLGGFQFKKGWYYYVGSAFGPGGLGARLTHHLTVSRKPHWHLDYLRPHTQVRDILISDENQHLEHVWAGILASHPGMSAPVRGFGSSDCRCPAHLFFSSKKI